MVRRLLWTLMIFAAIGPALGGAILVVLLNALDALYGRDIDPIRSLVTMAPYFWSFAWSQAVLIALAMLLAWRLFPDRRARLIATVPVGLIVMLLATPLLYGQPLVAFVTEPFGALLAISAGLATLPSQIIVEAIVARTGPDA
ncbi:hypothetical protein [Devosia sp.]|jgi:hypothetical protein|uniref:hypothetical protein n=1 Tax=Devosia sp. TaxID=1871048 RepID=UPI0037BFC505